MKNTLELVKLSHMIKKDHKCGRQMWSKHLRRASHEDVFMLIFYHFKDWPARIGQFHQKYQARFNYEDAERLS